MNLTTVTLIASAIVCLPTWCHAAVWDTFHHLSPATPGDLNWTNLTSVAVTACDDAGLDDIYVTPPLMSSTFLPGQAVGQLENPLIDEASGLAASRGNDDVLWVHNDSGDGPNVYALNSSGSHLGIYRLAGASSNDWEDMAIGPGPVTDQSYLYLGDIGDNNAVRSTIRVHRVAEPAVSSQQTPVDVILTEVETFSLQYPDGPRDAETLMVDPGSGDIYIVSKRDTVPRIYRAPFPQSTSDTITLESVGLLAWTVNSSQDWPTGGDISPNGDEVLVRSYVGATLWSVPGGMSIWDVLAGPADQVPLAVEPQGEAIAFDATGRNYYTVSEGAFQPIYFYERTADCDFNQDGVCGVSDLNALLAVGPVAPGVLAAGLEQFDLNGDGVIDNVDVDRWLADAAMSDELASPYQRGDANLDGVVDASDFNLWNAHKFSKTLRWDDGNFNGDSVTDAADFNIWNAHKFTASDRLSVVPEPGTGLLWLMALAIKTALVRNSQAMMGDRRCMNGRTS